MECLSPKHYALSPRISRHYGKMKEYFKTVSGEEDPLTKIDTGDLEVNPKRIEKWIGAALRESLKKGYIVKQLIDPKISILKVFGIDRETLSSNEVKLEHINRLYRALYVYSLGFYELIKEPLEGTQNKSQTLQAVWKVFSVLLQYVCKTEYSMVVAQLTKAYQLDIIKLEEQMAQNKAEYERIRYELETRISNLEDENMTLTENLEEAKESIELLTDENKKLLYTLEEERNMRLHFEDKLTSMTRQINDYKTQLKLSTEDLQKLTIDHKDAKNSTESLSSQLADMSKEKIKLEKLVSNYQAEAGSLKEELLSHKAIITQRDGRLKQAILEQVEATKEIQELKAALADKDIKISVIQSKVMDKKNETSGLQIELEKAKRIIGNCEERIRSLNSKYEQVCEDFKNVDSKYTALLKVETYLTEDNKSLKEQLSESQNKASMIELKYSGVEIHLKNLQEQHDIISKDYDKTIKTLEEINKSRNKVNDENINLENQLKHLKSDMEALSHNLYNEEALCKKLQERCREVEEENENLARRETANSQMAEIQISALESKYLGMFKKFKQEQKLKNKWIQSYQEEYNNHLKDEVELKKSNGAFQGQLQRNNELQSVNKNLQTSIEVLERQVEDLKVNEYNDIHIG